MVLSVYYDVAVLLLLFSVSDIQLADVLRKEAEIISIFHEFSPQILELVNTHAQLLRQRTQSDKTPVSLVNLINQQHSFSRPIVSTDFNIYPLKDPPEWTYEAYLVLSVKYIMSQGVELFDACYFKHNDKISHLCLMKVHRKLLCQKKPSDSTILTMLSGLKLPTSLLTKPEKVRIAQSIVDSNCGSHRESRIHAEKAVRDSPDDDSYRFILSELLSRNSKELIPRALDEIEVAIRLNSSKAEYHEKRLLLLMRLGRLVEAQKEASWIRQHVERVCKEVYCPSCPGSVRVKLPSRRSTKPAVPIPSLLVSWRPRLVLGLYHLLSANSSQAEREFTISLDLASSASVFDGQMQVADHVINDLMYMKAVAHLFTGNVKDAMDTALKIAHTNPAALDATVFVAHLLARSGFYQRTLAMLNLVVVLLETLEGSQTNATYVELVTTTGLLKRVALQLRAWLQYRQGDIVSAEADAEQCLSLLPGDVVCSYVQTLCHLVSGRFVKSIRSAAPVLSRTADRQVTGSAEFIYLSYLKEWTRFLHAHLTHSIYGLQSLPGLSVRFLRAWTNAVVPLHSLSHYREQPGISAQHTWLIASPEHLNSIISTPHPSNTTTPRCLAIEFLNSWRTEPLYCQQLHWLRLKSFVCSLDVEVRPVFSSTLLPHSQTLGRRCRLTLAIGVLQVAETIRNFWCQSRRVSFTTCWSYTPSDQGDPDLHRPDTFELPGDKRHCTLPESKRHQPGDGGHSNCQPIASGSHRFTDAKVPGQPTWFDQLDFISNLLLLADPSETPSLWWPEETEREPERYDSPLPDDRSAEVRDDDDDDDEAMKDVESDAMEFDLQGDALQNNNTNPRQPIEATHDPGHDRDNIWHTGTVRKRKCFVHQNNPALGSVEYISSIIQLLHSSIRAHLRHGNTDAMKDHIKLTLTKGSLDEGLGNFSTREGIGYALDTIWAEAVILNLLVDVLVAGGREQRLVVDLYVPGRADLRDSSHFSADRLLVSVLMLSKDDTQTYDLCIFRASNKELHTSLIKEMDAAFTDFLSQGEKALASILTGTNTHKTPNRQTSPPTDNVYLMRAMRSAFYWLYYWIALEPIASSHSFHVGFSGLLAMLRSLGIEPGVLPDTTWNLEVEALFIGTPEEFADLCLENLYPTWLSISSLQLTWQMAPSALVRTPSDFIEILNLQAIDNC